MGGFSGTWDQFFVLIKVKQLPWGDLFQQISEWYKFNKDRQNSLVLRYKDFKRDHRGHVVMIAKFLGFELSEKAVDIIVDKSTVKTVSEKYKEIHENENSWNSNTSSFVRKGEVGDWVNYFSEEQSAYIEERCQQELEPLELRFEYTT